MNRKELQEFILNKWRESGKSKYAFAKKVGCTPEAIGHWERGNRLMTYDQAEKILQNLGYELVVKIEKC